jgi:hypothetical protein
MSMSDEKSALLKMVQDGKLTIEEGVKLLDALNDTENKAPSPGKKLGERFLRVRVDSAEAKVNVNIPLILLKVGSHLGNMIVGYIPDKARREMAEKGLDLSKINFEELVNLVEQGLVNGKLVDVDVHDPEKGRIRVEVYVD